MEYRRIKDQEDYDGKPPTDMESQYGKPFSGVDIVSNSGAVTINKPNWKLKSIVTLALALLTSSQAILIVWSKRAGKYDYSVTTANFSVEALKCIFSLAALVRIWNSHGVTADNKLSTTFGEVSVYPIPALLYLVKNLMQYYIFAYVDAPVVLFTRY